MREKTRDVGSFLNPTQTCNGVSEERYGGWGWGWGGEGQIEKDWHLCPGVNYCLSKFSVTKVKPSFFASIRVPKLPSGRNSTYKEPTGSLLTQRSLQMQKKAYPTT